MSRLQALFIVISLGWQTTTGFDLPRRQLLQFPELANTAQGSGLCNKEAASFITATNGSCPLKSTADDCKQSGCYGTRLSGFERVALRCSNPSDIPTLQRAAVVAGYDRAKCLRNQGNFPYLQAGAILKTVDFNSETSINAAMNQICNDTYMSLAMSLSTDVIEQSLCRQPTLVGTWCARSLYEMQSNRTIDKLCSPCGRHSKYLTPQQRKVYCMRDQTGNFCGTALMTYFGTSGTLSSAPDCAGLDVTTPGTCTDKCTAYLRDVVEQSGCCLTTAFNAAVSLAGSAKEVAAALKREWNYYQSDCKIKMQPACPIPHQAVVQFELQVNGLVNVDSSNLGYVCTAIRSAVSRWYVVSIDDVACSQMKGNVFWVEFITAASAQDITDDNLVVDNMSRQGILNIPELYQYLWSDETRPPTAVKLATPQYTQASPRSASPTNALWATMIALYLFL